MENIDNYPNLKNRLPLLPGSKTALSLAFLKSLSDGEFVFLCGMDQDFIINNKAMEYLKERLIELKIDHSLSNNVIKSN